ARRIVLSTSDSDSVSALTWTSVRAGDRAPTPILSPCPVQARMGRRSRAQVHPAGAALRPRTGPAPAPSVRRARHERRAWPMSFVLVPARHQLVRRFQVERLHELLAGARVTASAGRAVPVAPDAAVPWAVTSATHHGTRRNPLPAHR